VRRGRLGLLVVAAALAVPAPARAFTYWTPTGAWGSEGRAPGQFGTGVLGGGALRQYDDPAGIAVARDGTILVVDTSNNRVQRFTPTGRYLGQFGRRGQDKGFIRIRLTDRMFQPEGLAVDPAGAIYLADAGNDRVMKYSPAGRFRARLGKHGSYAAQYVQPWGIAVGAGRVFVADQGNYRIQRWTASGHSRGAFGRFGRDRGGLVTPYGVATSPRGDRVYVSDIVRHTVTVFSPGGRVLGQWGAPGIGAGEFLKPAGIAVGRDGTVYVADRCNRRVQRFDASGRYLEEFGAGVLDTPTFVAVDGARNVYVSDHHRVLRFSQVTTATRGAAPVRAAHHDRVDILCRDVAEYEGVEDPSGDF
jgi:DNA-binding beta-propeller fold protein YncE